MCLSLFSVCTGSNIRVAERVGLPLFQAIIDYDSDKFDAVVDRLLPLKYEITDGLLSGSRAQVPNITRGQSNLTKSASWGAHSPARGHPRGSKVVPLNSWGRVSY